MLSQLNVGVSRTVTCLWHSWVQTGGRMPRRESAMLWLGLALFTPACAGRTTWTPDIDAAAVARPEIAAARDAFWSAHEKADAAAMGARLTEDAVLYAPGMGEVRGRAAIEDAARQMFTQLRMTNFRIHTQELDISGDTAHELSTYSQTVHPSGGVPNTVRGRYLIVWRR